MQTAYKTIMDDRKRGFTNQTYGSQQSTSSAGGYQYINDQQAYQEAAAYIQAQRYNEAMNILNMIRMKNSMWFYYAAIAEHGLGNNIRAQEYAKTAVDMEPMNMQYILLYNQLSGAQQQYRTTSQTYGNNMNMLSYCYSILMCNCMLNMCCC